MQQAYSKKYRNYQTAVMCRLICIDHVVLIFTQNVHRKDAKDAKKQMIVVVVDDNLRVPGCMMCN